MKFLRRLATVILVLVLAVVAIGFFLPDSAHVERSTTIKAPPGRIFALISNYKQFNRWSPWHERDPNTQYRFEGPENGVGAKLHWHSDNPNVGTGSQEIVDSKQDTFVKTRLDFGAEGIAHAYFQIDPADGGSTVTWGFDNTFGMNLIGRYMGLMFDSWIGPDYERGLSNLKTVAEAE